jgi:hypothetical protein
MSLLAQQTRLVVLVMCVSMASARAEPAPGNAEVIKLIASALDIAYGKAKKVEAAETKLLYAVSVCERRGCSPDLHASIYGYLAILHWFFDPDHARAIRDLRTMRKIDPKEELDTEYATKVPLWRSSNPRPRRRQRRTRSARGPRGNPESRRGKRPTKHARAPKSVRTRSEGPPKRRRRPPARRRKKKRKPRAGPPRRRRKPRARP